MNQVLNIQGSINKIKTHSQQLKDEIDTIIEKDVSASFYAGNLKRLSLQALDLFTAMQKQIAFLSNQRKFVEIREKTRYKKGVTHE